MSEASNASVVLTEPFHGLVWLTASPGPSRRMVRLALSIERSWDADILIDRDAVDALAGSLGGSGLHITTGVTVDGSAVVLAVEGDRLAVTILDDRISDVLVLGGLAGVIGDRLRAAATESP